MKRRFVETVLRTAKTPLGGCLVDSSMRVEDLVERKVS